MIYVDELEAVCNEDLDFTTLLLELDLGTRQAARAQGSSKLWVQNLSSPHVTSSHTASYTSFFFPPFSPIYVNICLVTHQKSSRLVLNLRDSSSLPSTSSRAGSCPCLSMEYGIRNRNPIIVELFPSQ